MQDNKVSILSTRPLNELLIQKAAANNIVIDSLSFISTEPILGQHLKDTILNLSQQSATVIFTSMNAVEAVAGYLGGYQPVWTIFCIGSATKKNINRYFYNSQITATANNASSLADKIIENNVQDAVFFCGDQRREELPNKLVQHNIYLNEIAVYTTTYSPQKITKNYNGILFFSPSAVKGFFLANTIYKDTLIFSIGTTTANSVRQFCTNTIVISDVADKETLVEKTIIYFAKSNNDNEHIQK